MEKPMDLITQYSLEKRDEDIALRMPAGINKAVNYLLNDCNGTLKIFTPDFWDITRYNLSIESLNQFLSMGARKLEIIAVNFKPDESALAPLLANENKVELHRLLPEELYSESEHIKRNSEMPTMIITEPLGYYLEFEQRTPKKLYIDGLVNFGNEKTRNTAIFSFGVLKKFSIPLKLKTFVR